MVPSFGWVLILQFIIENLPLESAQAYLPLTAVYITYYFFNLCRSCYLFGTKVPELKPIKLGDLTL